LNFRGSGIITVGDELVLGEIENRNQDFMARELRKAGLPASIAITVSDDPSEISTWIKLLLEDGYRPLFISGGLGGTHDDRTRDAIAMALDLPLERHAECMEVLKRSYGDRLNAQRSRMADLPPGAQLISNLKGAPGFSIHSIFAFPGFPSMLHPMLKDVLSNLKSEYEVDMLQESFDCTEGTLALEVEAFSSQWPGIQVGLYADPNPGIRRVSVKIRTQGKVGPELKQAFRELTARLKTLAQNPI
jgi:molybdenum cofactor synthesis domain-containing protein